MGFIFTQVSASVKKFFFQKKVFAASCISLEDHKLINNGFLFELYKRNPQIQSHMDYGVL